MDRQAYQCDLLAHAISVKRWPLSWTGTLVAWRPWHSVQSLRRLVALRVSGNAKLARLWMHRLLICQTSFLCRRACGAVVKTAKHRSSARRCATPAPSRPRQCYSAHPPLQFPGLSLTLPLLSYVVGAGLCVGWIAAELAVAAQIEGCCFVVDRAP